MNSARILTTDPFAFIKDCVINHRVLWTYHVSVRMKGRYIPREMILGAVDPYELIEEYPDDKYLPSYLIFARFRRYIFHVLFAADVEMENVRAVTAYYPDPSEWEPDLKRRRRS